MEKKIGVTLATYRKKKKLSQIELAVAEAVDCSRRTIGYIERGVHDPSVQMAYRIANYFKVALPVLFPDLNEKTNEQEGVQHGT